MIKVYWRAAGASLRVGGAALVIFLKSWRTVSFSQWEANACGRRHLSYETTDQHGAKQSLHNTHHQQY